MIDAEKLVDALVASCGGERQGASGSTPGSTSGSTSGDAIRAALADYTRRRWARVVFYQAQSRLLTPLFASRSEVLRALRDTFANVGCHAPGLQRYAHAVLCGAQSPNLIGTIPEHEYLGFLDELASLGKKPEEAGVQ